MILDGVTSFLEGLRWACGYALFAVALYLGGWGVFCWMFPKKHQQPEE